MKIGPLEWLPFDGTFRPSLWISLPHATLVIFFGWQWPPHVLWLR
jgi:hypothetical protein